MYFWKIQKLCNELKANPLPEAESFKYLLACTIVFSIAIIPIFEANYYDIVGAVVEAIIAIFGVIYIYHCNGGASGNYILQRYFALGWVVGIRWLVLAVIPISIVYFIVLEILSEVPETTTIQEVLLLSVLYIAYFWRLGIYVRQVSVTDTA